MTEQEDQGSKYDKTRAERSAHVAAVTASKAKKKVVVAGPGTGKTTLFKEILKSHKKTLTLSFINTLVDDLSLELCGASDVRTLHGFARSELARCTGKDIAIFPRLSLVIAEDAAILLGKQIDFDTIFHERDDHNTGLPFYRDRKNYYGPYYGLSDVVFALCLYYEGHDHKIPTYDHIVVDEFQDFNRLEVSLIDLLGHKSPVLLAGDDDQALYDFKKATPDFIRQRHGDTTGEYESFSLPFCSRSTRVIVEAANDLLKKSDELGLMPGRIKKRYDYFDDAKKDEESAQHPRIAHHEMYAAQIPWLIDRELGRIAEQERRQVSVLVITPTKTQMRAIAHGLRKKGYGRVAMQDRKDFAGATLLDGLHLLLDEPKSSLGWRIVAKALMKDSAFGQALTKSHASNALPFQKLLPKEVVAEAKSLLKTLKAISDEKPVSRDDLLSFMERVNLPTDEVLADTIRNDLEARSRAPGQAATRNFNITVTTVQSSKGLAAEYVFFAHCEDVFLIKEKGKITPRDICSFLVGLTRARKKLFLISNPGKTATFVSWIRKERLELHKAPGPK